MIVIKRWEQVQSMDPLNPYQRWQVYPGYGSTGSNAWQSFYWNPRSTDGIQQLAGPRLLGDDTTTVPATGPTSIATSPAAPQISTTWKTWAVLGGLAGVVGGVALAMGAFR